MSRVHTWLNVCRWTGCVHNHGAETQNRMRACLARDVNINVRVPTCYACYAALVHTSVEIPQGLSKIEIAPRPLQACGNNRSESGTLYVSLVGKDRSDQWHTQCRVSVLKSIQLYRICQTISQIRLYGALSDTSIATLERRCKISKHIPTLRHT